MSDDIALAAQHWDDYTKKFAGKRSGLYWYELPGVLGYINQRISGRFDIDWITHTVEKHFPAGAVDRCLSLGCGTGHLERDLARLGAFGRCDAYDVSAEAIKLAKQLAQESGYTHISYRVADINQLQLPEASFDVAFFYGSLHHFHALEHVLDQVRSCLKPGGLLAFNEYVGPARFQFPERQKEVANLCLKLLPLRYRKIVEEARRAEFEKSRKRPVEPGGQSPQGDSLWSRIRKRLLSSRRRLAAEPPADPLGRPDAGQGPLYREEVGFPSVDDVIEDDPSESVRSDEIMDLVRRRFEVIEETAWGGNIPQFLLSGIAGNFEDDDECAQALLEMIWKIDSTMIQCGEFKSDCAYVVARPLPG